MRSSEIQNVGPVAQLALTTTAATVFQALNPHLSAPSLAAILGVPGTGRLPRRQFIVQLSGIINNAGAAANGTIALAVGTDTNTANDTIIAPTGALAIPAATAVPFWLAARLVYTSVSGVLYGNFDGQIGNVLVSKAGILANPGGLNDANEPVFNMVALATLSVANALSYAILDTFAIEA